MAWASGQYTNVVYSLYQHYGWQSGTTGSGETSTYHLEVPVDKQCCILRGSPPPELHETGTIWKHWNRATIYAETKCVHEQLTEIHMLECGLKNCKTWGPPSPRGYQPTKLVFIFAWRSNHPCYSHIISIHKLFIGVWYLTLQDSLLTLGACFQAWDESGSRRSRSSYLPFQAPTQLSVLELQIGDRKLGRTCERGN